MHIHLRRAAPADALRVAEIHVSTWQAAYPAIIPERVHPTRAAREALWTRSLSDPDNPIQTWVAETDGEIRGFASICACRDEDVDRTKVAELVALYVEPSAWGRGVAQRLFEQVRTELRSRGFEALTLWVLRENTRARRFYEAQGFEPDGAELLKPLQDTVLDEVRYRGAL